MRLVRSNATKWSINPDKIGVMGFSAGGHLAGVTATCYNDTLVGDEQSDISAKPNFACLIYPVVSFFESYSHGGSRWNLAGPKATKELLTQLSPERRLTKDTGPLFIAGSQWDFVKSENILELALNAKEAGAQCELHMFAATDHGYGMGRVGQTEQDNPAIAWVELCLKFIQRL